MALHGQETDVFADAGYQGAHKRPEAKVLPFAALSRNTFIKYLIEDDLIGS